ncbi:MAG: NUDIX hydrolase [Acidobacteriota bacterium]|nr:NUDIX hydrolase [Acidobacteriota bacterium]
MNIDSIGLELDRYEEVSVSDDATVGRTRALLAGTAEPLSRHQYKPGHITASACVLSPTGDRVLLVHHKKLGFWVQPGGHVDVGDESLLAGARREAIEECGVSPLSLLRPNHPIDIEIHSIPARPNEPAHLHYDIRYAFRAPLSGLPTKNAESHAVEWVSVARLGTYTNEESLHRLVRRAGERL